MIIANWCFSSDSISLQSFCSSLTLFGRFHETVFYAITNFNLETILILLRLHTIFSLNWEVSWAWLRGLNEAKGNSILVCQVHFPYRFVSYLSQSGSHGSASYFVRPCPKNRVISDRSSSRFMSKNDFGSFFTLENIFFSKLASWARIFSLE